MQNKLNYITAIVIVESVIHGDLKIISKKAFHISYQPALAPQSGLVKQVEGAPSFNSV